jgi:cytochrome c peroxidase
MASSQLRFVGGTPAIVLCGFLFLFAFLLASTVGSRAQEPEDNYGIGIPDVFLSKYLNYRAQQFNSNNSAVLRIRLGYVKGLSRSFTTMRGEMTVDLESGAFEIGLRGLTPGETYGVWLVDRTESDGIVPDTAFGLTTILAVEPSTVVTGVLGVNLPLGFTIDRIVVAPGVAWGAEALAAGSVDVFQKIFFRRLTLLNASTGAVLFEETTPAPTLFTLVPDIVTETEAAQLVSTATMSTPLTPDSVSSSSPSASSSSGGSSSLSLDILISQGAKLFFEGTFGGNGRTCGTCHPARNNFTIDPDFIRTLPATDPLFVAEFNPALAQLERPQLMRSFGLILENLDGFSDPANKFVMRGVPHTLGLPVSLTRDTSLADPPADMTGWSGDGSPGTGSLREFAIGAVTQHFTQHLQRVEGSDFKLPSEHQLDAMEAFQLSLGRDRDFDLSKITFQDANVDTGRSLFINGDGNPLGGKCAFCHSNAGALDASGQNRNFNTNVEDVNHPARRVQDFPKDGGFGRTANPDGTFGNATFNTAPVVEAADTAPFFHNNVVSTLEDVVRFYSGPEFNKPRPLVGGFNFNKTQIEQIADFLRGMNTLQNVNIARRELQEILANKTNPQREQDRRLQMAFDDTQDAIDVLNQGGIFPSAITELNSAKDLIMEAQNTGDASQRRTLAQQAITSLDRAGNAIATIAP